MTVVIHKGEAFLGIPLTKARNVLRAWHFGKSRDPYDIARLKYVGLQPTTVMGLLEEFRGLGLIGEERYADGGLLLTEGLTEAGMALAGAVAQRKIKRQSAIRVLEQFLQTCASANLDPDCLFTVTQVWLFGSLLGEAD